MTHESSESHPFTELLTVELSDYVEPYPQEVRDILAKGEMVVIREPEYLRDVRYNGIFPEGPVESAFSTATNPAAQAPITIESIRETMEQLLRGPGAQTQAQTNQQQGQPQVAQQQVQAQPDLSPRRVTMPPFELQSNPRINIDEIRNRRFDLMGMQQSMVQQIQEEEDRRILQVLDAALLPTTAPVPAPPRRRPLPKEKTPQEEVVVRKSRLERILDWDF